MTNAVAVIGLTYKTVDVQDADFGIFLEIVRGLNDSPTVRGTDTIVPNLAGRIARNRVGDVLQIELRGVVMGDGSTISDQRADFAGHRQSVRTLFDPTADPGDLVAALEDGSTATISARTLPGTLWTQDGDADATLSIVLESVDPDWVIEPGP